ncbi:MAG: B12-binding domain-containing radical SAM protein [Desulfomonile tiedjei]|uniref:B12-binding domain-containing radical SAM protein n=1 Tax=Desulfomonile tiedjei TaxID=2358 RepID=A0A9D6Z8H0_9BACT|nr:B12-binding domain-containing radical SAM protein [Desulfomonile tiedjei]
MKAVLLRPPFYALFGVTTPKMKTYPLNLLYLATYARDIGGHDIAVLDGENISVPGLEPPEGVTDPEIIMNRGIPRMIRLLEDPDHALWSEIERKLVAENPDLVGITCNSGNMDTAALLTKRLKGLGLTVVLGGSHPTVLPEQSLRYTSADMVAIGEGELTLVRLLNTLSRGKSLADIPSLAWRNERDIVVNPRGKLIDAIDSLPIPDRSFVRRSEYFGEVMMTGRGCPFNCGYCASRNIWGRSVRLRSAGSIIHELEMLATQSEKMPDPLPGRWVVKIVDDTFSVNRKRTISLLEEIISTGLNRMEFTGGVRADTLDENVVQKMHEANFRRVTLGVESGSPKILKMIRKGETNEDVTRALKLLREAGIRSHAFFMIGFPDETSEDIEMSKRLILEAQPDYVEINMVTPYPGTDLFQRLISEDPMDIRQWYRWFHQGLATHSDRLGYDLDLAYNDFLSFARDYNASHV